MNWQWKLIYCHQHASALFLYFYIPVVITWRVHVVNKAYWQSLHLQGYMSSYLILRVKQKNRDLILLNTTARFSYSARDWNWDLKFVNLVLNRLIICASSIWKALLLQRTRHEICYYLCGLSKFKFIQLFIKLRGGFYGIKWHDRHESNGHNK